MKQFQNIYYFFSNVEFNPKLFLNDIFPAVTDTDMAEDGTIKIELNDKGIINKFTFNYKDSSYNCSYTYQKLNGENTVFKVSITLFYTSKKEKAAHAFSDLIQTIESNKRNDFYMTPIVDSLSTYYSDRLYSKLALYERSMRSLISSIFIPVYKNNWAKELLETLVDEVKIKGNEKYRIEKALEELNLSDLESIFFDKKLNINADNYDSMFKIGEIDSLTKEELMKLIDKHRPQSLWQNEISKYATIDNAQKRMENIRELRNRIAHNKTFTVRNFKELRKELNFITPKLNEAEEKILKSRDQKILLPTLRKTLERISEVTLSDSYFIKITKQISNLGEALIKYSNLDSIGKLAVHAKMLTDNMAKHRTEESKEGEE